MRKTRNQGHANKISSSLSTEWFKIHETQHVIGIFSHVGNPKQVLQKHICGNMVQLQIQNNGYSIRLQ